MSTYTVTCRGSSQEFSVGFPLAEVRNHFGVLGGSLFEAGNPKTPVAEGQEGKTYSLENGTPLEDVIAKQVGCLNGLSGGAPTILEKWLYNPPSHSYKGAALYFRRSTKTNQLFALGAISGSPVSWELVHPTADPHVFKLMQPVTTLVVSSPRSLLLVTETGNDVMLHPECGQSMMLRMHSIYTGRLKAFDGKLVSLLFEPTTKARLQSHPDGGNFPREVVASVYLEDNDKEEEYTVQVLSPNLLAMHVGASNRCWLWVQSAAELRDLLQPRNVLECFEDGGEARPLTDDDEEEVVDEGGLTGSAAPEEEGEDELMEAEFEGQGGDKGGGSEDENWQTVEGEEDAEGWSSEEGSEESKGEDTRPAAPKGGDPRRSPMFERPRAVPELDGLDKRVRASIEEVMTPSSTSGWVIASYDDNDCLSHVSHGKGGMEALQKHLHDDQIQYLLVRIIAKNKSVQQLLTGSQTGPGGGVLARRRAGKGMIGVTTDVFVVWCGPQVPKIARARKLPDSAQVQRLFEPFHCQLVISNKKHFNDSTLSAHATSGSHVLE